jgi:hypothetical protein
MTMPDMIRVFEGYCAAIERVIIEVPYRRGKLPDELVEILRVFFVAGASCPMAQLLIRGGQRLLTPSARFRSATLAADPIQFRDRRFSSELPAPQ